MKEKVFILTYVEDVGMPIVDYTTIVKTFKGEPSIPALQNALIEDGLSGEGVNQAISEYRLMLDGRIGFDVILTYDKYENFYCFDVRELE